ncbi:MAG: VCBS repeat-containing protein [Deferribacterota bacterium]|nr:VCBS repeat-containing protein [Deferribacterota bacterium]
MLIYSTLNLYAYESMFDSLSLNKDFYVIRVKDGKIYTDIGKDQGGFEGLKIKIYKQVEEIKHPITGEILGITKDKICEAKLDEVYERFSITYTHCPEAKVKDIVNVSQDFNIFVNYKNEVDEYFKRLVENDITSNNYNIVNDPSKADLILDVSKVYRGEYSLSLKTKDNSVIASKVIKEEEKMAQEGDFKERKKITLDTLLKSISVADVDGDKTDEVVGSSKDKVIIYKIEEKESVRENVLDGFNSIINVEVADLNGNGIDEIFVVDFPYVGDVSTKIYEYNGESYSKIESLPYFVRSFIIDGIPYIIGQRQHFERLTRGKIFTVVYEEGSYKEGITFDTPEGFRLYGFFTEGSESIYIDDEGKILKGVGRSVVDKVPSSLGLYLNTFKTRYGMLEGERRKDLFTEIHREGYEDAFKLRENEEEKVVFEFSPKSRLFKFNNFIYAYINVPLTSFIENKLIVTSSKILQIGKDSMLVSYVGSGLSKNVYDMYMKVNEFGEYYFYVLESNPKTVDLNIFGNEGNSNLIILKY